jgi:pyrroline-5-carboxylate reductase
MELSVGIIGCGTMGKCILRGLECTADKKIYASVASEESKQELQRLYPHVSVVTENKTVVLNSDIIIISTKPHVALKVLEENQKLLNDKIVISICAGVTLETLSKFSNAHVLRAMTNTPSLINQGMTTICGNVPKSILEITENLFKPLGKTLILDEKHFDTVTAMAGSGPAFVW